MRIRLWPQLLCGRGYRVMAYVRVCLCCVVRVAVSWKRRGIFAIPVQVDVRATLPYLTAEGSVYPPHVPHIIWFRTTHNEDADAYRWTGTRDPPARSLPARLVRDRMEEIHLRRVVLLREGCPLVMRLRSEFEEKGDVPEIVGSYSSENKKGGSFYGLSERKRKREGGAGRKGCGLTAYATSD